MSHLKVATIVFYNLAILGYYSPEQMGLLDPSTSDGRVIFFLPWQKQTIAGTTDLPCEVTRNPSPTEDEITFILDEVKNYLNPDVEGMKDRPLFQINFYIELFQ